ncbi:MAG: FkbM family methyltransferase [Bacteroides sp.]|jgi:FkbM family methyltransferase|nr:FkbM family methyltransferase [Bacteroides sp.]
MEFKTLIKKGLSQLHIDLTRNMHYDRLTWQIMDRTIKPGSNCIDIGCHKGEVLDRMVKLSPNGTHFAFEPIPLYFHKLRSRFNGNVSIYPYALSGSNGEAEFQFVKNAPAYSGLKMRKYDIKNPDIEAIRVVKKRLDDVIPETLVIHFIKLDVEGGEYDVLQGARRILEKQKPVVVFESGLGASEFYGTKPEELFTYLVTELGFKISLLKDFILKKPALEKEKFLTVYRTAEEYYFVAHP